LCTAPPTANYIYENEKNEPEHEIEDTIILLARSFIEAL
jgi:hypothetical protein